MKGLRVVVYTDSAGIGGAEISLGHLTSSVSDEIEMIVVGTCQSIVDTIADRRPSATRLILPESFLAHLQAFRQLNPDIIHFNCCTPWANAIAIAAALLVPKVRVVRVDQLPLRTTDALMLWRTRFLSLRLDAHVAVGEASCRRMEDFYALGRHSLISIPNGVPDAWENLQRSPPPRTQRMVVGSIGRLDAMKAHDILLRSVAPLEGVQVVILGEGEQRQNLEKLAETLGMGDRLNLPGWVDDPHTYLTQFDCIALPSRSEGFPLAMVEAMLAERPVVATRVGSIPEAIVDGRTGLLVEKDDVWGLTEALRRLRDEPSLRLQLGQQARGMAIGHFTDRAMAASYEHLWHHLVTVPRVPRLRVKRPQD